MNEFQKLGISARTAGILDKLGFTQPTPIQQQAIPVLLGENPVDLIGLAQTGTGKTAAFGLPLLELLDTHATGVQALIMAPTRELAQQTATQLRSFAANSINIEVVYGGAAISNQIKALRKPVQIVVATPGRLLDLIKRQAISLKNVRYVVLDEADEMLNMGFKEDIDKILAHTPADRVTWLFSATMPAGIRKIVHKYMHEPREVAVNTHQKSNVDISHQYIVTSAADKLLALQRLLDLHTDMRGVLFCRTRRETKDIALKLAQQGHGVEALHGELSQAQREAVMKRFKARSMQLLIATDVAARGIDVSNLTHVLHHTLPDQLESYTHRSGRTGRAGNKGVSLAFINPRERRRITELERKNKISFEEVFVPGAHELADIKITRWAENLSSTTEHAQAGEALAKVADKFADMSKDELLKKLISNELNKLNSSSGFEKKRNNREVAKAGIEKPGSIRRFYINIGSMDGLTKSDLLHFLSDVSRIKRKRFGKVTVNKNFSLFEVEQKWSRDLPQYFQGLEVDGRSIEVRSDEKPARQAHMRVA